MPQPDYSYRASVLRVVDGDTVELRADLGFRVFVDVTVRLWGIDAPEVHGATREAGLKAAARVRELCPAGAAVVLCSRALDKYGRSVGSLTLADGADVARTLLAEGLAVVKWDDEKSRP